MLPDLRADLYARKAKILEERLAAPDLAIEAWRETIACRPDHQEAFVAIERLLEAAGRAAELAETLEKHAEVAVEAREREQLTKRVAVLHEKVLGQPEKAIAAWRSVLDHGRGKRGGARCPRTTVQRARRLDEPGRGAAAKSRGLSRRGDLAPPVFAGGPAS